MCAVCSLDTMSMHVLEVGLGVSLQNREILFI